MPAKFDNDFMKIAGRIRETIWQKGYFYKIEVEIHACNRITHTRWNLRTHNFGQHLIFMRLITSRRSSSPLLENIIKPISMIDH